jgi:hypothetical protein
MLKCCNTTRFTAIALSANADSSRALLFLGATNKKDYAETLFINVTPVLTQECDNKLKYIVNL